MKVCEEGWIEDDFKTVRKERRHHDIYQNFEARNIFEIF